MQLKKYCNHTFIRFLVIGACNTAFGYGLFSLLIYLHFHYAIALLIATVTGMLFSFKTLGHLVFKNTDNSRLFRYIFTYGMVYLLNVAQIKFYLLFSANLYLNGLIATAFGAMISFLLNVKWVYAPAKKPLTRSN